MNNDKQDFDDWLKANDLHPARRQRATWLNIWKASRLALVKEKKKSPWWRIFG